MSSADTAGHDQVITTKNDYFRFTGAAIGAIMVIQVLPKGLPGEHLRDPYRLVLTVAYFAAWLVLLWSQLGKRSQYLQTLYAWRYLDAGPALEKNWKLYLYSLEQAITPPIILGLAFFGSFGLKVLAEWFSPFSAFSPVYNIGFWGSLIGLAVFPFVAGNRISEMMQRYKALNESVDTGTFTPRDTKDLAKRAIQEEETSLVVIDDFRFKAGGYQWHWSDFYKNCIVFGQSGTGKTLCVLNTLLEGLLASTAMTTHKPSGLILDPKGDFKDKIGHLCRKYNRESDLVIIDPSHPENSIRWNPFDSDDDVLELAARFASVLESTKDKSSGNDTFWIDSAKKFIRHAISLVRLTNEPGVPPSFSDIMLLVTSMDELSNRADQVPDDDSRADQALNFFANEWVEYASETRTSIQGYITNMIDPFLMEPYISTLSGKSDVTLETAVERGKLVYVYMPIADKEAMSRSINSFVKLEFFREILKRPDKERPSFFICDEFQSFFTTKQGKGDPDFFERSRQSNHANIIATQNLPALLKQTENTNPVYNLIGNCGLKIFLRNTDVKTNEYASKLFGQHIVDMSGSNYSSGGGPKGLGGPQASSSINRQYDAKIRPEEFIELAVPDRGEKIRYAASIAQLASRGTVKVKRLRWQIHPL